MNLPWWIWPVALVAAVLVLAYFARKSWRAGVRSGFKAHLAANLPEWQLVEERPSLLVLRHAASATTLPFQLESLYGAVIEAKAESPEDRSKLYAQAAGALTEALEAQGPLNPERDLPRILPRLVRREFIEASQAQGLVHQPLSGTDLFISYVIDRANSVQYLMEPHREELGEDLIRLHERALENLAQKVPLESMRAAFTSGQVNVLKTMDQHDAARLLLLPSLLPHGLTVAAAVPDRDTLVVAPAPADENWESVVPLATAAAGPPLLARPLRVSKWGIEQK